MGAFHQIYGNTTLFADSSRGSNLQTHGLLKYDDLTVLQGYDMIACVDEI